jgi:hypothetical protein
MKLKSVYDRRQTHFMAIYRFWNRCKEVEAQRFIILTYLRSYWCLFLSKNGFKAALLETTASLKIRIWKSLVSQWKSAE